MALFAEFLPLFGAWAKSDHLQQGLNALVT